MQIIQDVEPNDGKTYSLCRVFFEGQPTSPYVFQTQADGVSITAGNSFQALLQQAFLNQNPVTIFYCCDGWGVGQWTGKKIKRVIVYR